MNLNLDEIKQLLKIKQSDSKNPDDFEKAIALAFRTLGFNSKHIGGSNETDVLLEHDGIKIIVDGKSTGKKSIVERFINFDSLERYQEKHKAHHLCVVAKSFASGNIRKTAKKRGVVLLETESLCCLLENQKIYRYNPRQIIENLFTKGIPVMTPNDILPSFSDQQNLIEIIKTILDLNRVGNFTLENLLFHLKAKEIECNEDTVKQAIDFLLKPPLRILEPNGDEYKFTLDAEQMQNCLGILVTALNHKEKDTPQQPPKLPSKIGLPRGNGKKVTQKDFIHLHDGVFEYADNKNIKINVDCTGHELEEQLRSHGFTWTGNIKNLYFSLRGKAGLLKSRG